MTSLFFSPPIKNKIQDKFDVVINTSSFGEMPSSIANDYLNWIPSILIEDGILISHNSVNRTPGGIKRYSDYDFSQFSPVGLYPQPVPAGPLHDQHLVIVLTKGNNFNSKGLDYFGGMVHLGLHDDIHGFMSEFVKSRLDPREIWENKESLIGGYVSAGSHFNRKKLAGFEKYLNEGKSPIALSYCKRILNLKNPKTPEYLSADKFKVGKIIKRFKTAGNMIEKKIFLLAGSF